MTKPIAPDRLIEAADALLWRLRGVGVMDAELLIADVPASSQCTTAELVEALAFLARLGVVELRKDRHV